MLLQTAPCRIWEELQIWAPLISVTIKWNFYHFFIIHFSQCFILSKRKSPMFLESLPGAMSSGMSNEYVPRENFGVWSLTSLTVMLSLMSDDCFPSSARTRREYLERRSRSSFFVAIRSPDSGSILKLSSAPLMMVYVTRALGPWGGESQHRC